MNFSFANWKSEREGLDKYLFVDDFRMFYTLKGKHSLPKKNQVDKDKNNIPDYIENLMFRLIQSKKIYVDVLKFKNPLSSKRYKDVKYIDIHILKSEGSSAGDAVIFYNYKSFNNKYKSISMKLSNNLREGTYTPSHEYFHILQNAYSMFKNRWYTEGTARWSERIFKKGTGKREPLPKSQKELDKLLKKTYSTKYFWRRLAYICDTNNGRFLLPENFQTKFKDYPVFIEDSRIYGFDFMKHFFKNLGIEAKKASQDRGFNEFDWSEYEQRENTNNNKYILKALRVSIKQSCQPLNYEVRAFLNMLNNYLG